MNAEPDRTAAATPHSGDLVTVAIPALNEEATIGAALDSVARQTERNLQIVVVDGGSQDGTRRIVEAYAAKDPRVELLHNPGRIIPKALNVALAAARGSWFVRVDAHSEVPSDYVRKVVEHLESGRWGGVGGRKNGVGVTPAGRAVAAAMRSRFGVGNSTYHYGTKLQTVDHVPFGGYPTELARRLGGWDERLTSNEDFEFDYRVMQSGQELLFDPTLVIEWSCRQSIAALFRQYRRYGRAKVDVLRLHPRSLRVRHLAAPALVAWLAGAAVLIFRRPRLGTLAVSPYVLGLAGAVAVTAKDVDGFAARTRLPGAFLAMHLGWGMGFWEGIIKAPGGRAGSAAMAP